MPKLVCKKNHLNEEIKEKEAKVGKIIALRWDVTLEAKNFNEN